MNPLSPDLLRIRCDLAGHEFDTTAELEPWSGGLGQDRAEQALLFGLTMDHPGYHVFALGEPGTGRHANVFRLLESLAAKGKTPPDICYVHNFESSHSPRLLRLPAGRGGQLRADLQKLMRELIPAIAAALDADTHVKRVESLQEAYKAREEEAIADLGKACEADGLQLLNTADGFVFVPCFKGEPLSSEAFKALSKQEQKGFEARSETWSQTLADLLSDFPGWRQELEEAMAKAEREALLPVLKHLTRALRHQYGDLPEVLSFIDGVCEDVIANIRGEIIDEEGVAEESGSESAGLNLQRYQVNLLVDHSQTKGTPVVCEDNPGFGNLIGRIEHWGIPGSQTSHFNLIRAGALHRASGGYLVLDAHRLLNQPYAWDALKRSLRSGLVTIEPPAEAQGWSGQATLAPEPCSCQVKVVLIGERELFYTLTENDPDFAELFKVAADFDDDLPRTPETEFQFARLLGALGRHAELLPFDRSAVARLVEEAARHAEHAHRLSLHTRYLADLMREADYYARTSSSNPTRVMAEDIERALMARNRRADRYSRHVLESTLEGSTLIATSGERAGQANALVVVELAGERYGHPVRVTATARVGDGDVVDIERETELGGAIHSKGVLILTAFLASRYARHQPLSLAASLVFEQSYGLVEGDSASLAELCALLSSLAQAPIRQNLALTGSVNQFGEVQVVGGVNEKIEGFFDLCKARGLSGDQGVLIPAVSVNHLMLREEVVAAARAGQFHIWPVASVDEAMQHLTGLAAGVPDTRGHLPKGSLNERVAKTLAEMTAALHPSGEDRPAWRKSPRHNRVSNH